MRDFSIDLVWAKIQGAITVIGGWLGYFLGGLDGLMIALVVFVILDYVTGHHVRDQRPGSCPAPWASGASAAKC